MQSGGLSYRKSDLSFFYSRVSYSCYFAFTATPKLANLLLELYAGSVPDRQSRLHLNNLNTC
ncbi:hypothetical protein PHYSODRAFT_358110 [Phytophthora sojae]|uniref:Uncharacterized protein n=1 Tax=Phytophthora sojae (strain P6497) TaxID=1094619 RepID=G5AIT8_PHYSP|nr:hypothetical protein PHYSODRAFT_358110 [Phytophthora sojae]EGZ04551.1 hypothetical protein PHYSODRAFT_358110 [Phytophthora sojae]|eukprot:XP_009539989.1 hypothetical protein PHYSODRAFT_358110 [Phytophthora sojae]